MANSIPITARDCCLKEKKRLVKALKRCDSRSINAEERHKCYRSTAQESGRRSRQCIIE
jgi:hypothetical protein